MIHLQDDVVHKLERTCERGFRPSTSIDIELFQGWFRHVPLQPESKRS